MIVLAACPILACVRQTDTSCISTNNTIDMHQSSVEREITVCASCFRRFQTTKRFSVDFWGEHKIVIRNQILGKKYVVMFLLNAPC